jgi:hypothetical protein
MSEYKLVPVEPTEAMIKAGRDAWNKILRAASGDERLSHEFRTETEYKAMLAASPPTDTVNISKADHDALVADADRYRFLRKKVFYNQDGVYLSCGAWDSKMREQSAIETDKFLDQAIDNARSES